MPITILSGVLDRYHELLGQGVVNAYVVYTMSNGVTAENAHLGLPVAALNAVAANAGRSRYSPADICTFIEHNVPDLVGTPITSAVPPV